jgi:TRAP transporter TAXI family solute receptor
MASRALPNLSYLVLGFALIAQFPAQGATAGAIAQPASLGLIAGDTAGSETVLASDVADLFASSATLRVVPLAGDAGQGNIKRLLDEPHADIAFVAMDALAAARTEDQAGKLAERLQLVARLGPQEIHIVARQDIESLAGLVGQKVNIGPAGSSTAVTAGILFKMLGTAIEPVALDGATAIEELKRGAIAATLVVGAKPVPLIAGIAPGYGLHLLPIDFGASLEEAYLPTNLGHDDYPNLIAPSASLPTLATGMALLTAKAKNDPGSKARMASFVDTLFSRLGELQTEDHHPKWREINLAAHVPGLTRTAAAEAWLAAHRADTVKPVAVSGKIEAGASEPPPINPDHKEALFKAFIEWQRAKN